MWCDDVGLLLFLLHLDPRRVDPVPPPVKSSVGNSYVPLVMFIMGRSGCGWLVFCGCKRSVWGRCESRSQGGGRIEAKEQAFREKGIFFALRVRNGVDQSHPFGRGASPRAVTTVTRNSNLSYTNTKLTSGVLGCLVAPISQGRGPLSVRGLRRM